MTNVSKTQRQQQQAEMWRNAKGLGGFKNPTGFGKTYQTLNFICRPMIEKNHLTFFIVVVHTVALKKQWIEQIAKHLPGMEDRFTVDTVQSIYTKGNKLQCTCLIIDELDEFFSPERRKIWDDNYIDFKFLCWLSATPEDRRKRHIEFMEKYPMLDQVTVQEALANGWIAPYREFNIGVQLTEQEKIGYDEISQALHKEFAKFNFDFDLVNKCLRKSSQDSNGRTWTGFQWACMVAARNGWKIEYSDYVKNGFPKGYSSRDIDTINDIYNLWNPGAVIGFAKRVMQGIRERVRIIYNSKAKRELAVEICKKFPDRKTILFSQSVDFAESVSKDLNANGITTLVYHSELESRPLRINIHGQPDLFGTGDYVRNKSGKKSGEPKIFGKDKIRELTIGAVANGVCNHLSTASALDKGLDIPDIELAVVTSMSSNPTQYVQRRGRTTRMNPDGNPSYVYVINVYALETKDEQFLRSAQKDQEHVFWIDSLDKITDGLVETTDSFTMDDL